MAPIVVSASRREHWPPRFPESADELRFEQEANDPNVFETIGSETCKPLIAKCGILSIA